MPITCVHSVALALALGIFVPHALAQEAALNTIKQSVEKIFHEDSSCAPVDYTAKIIFKGKIGSLWTFNATTKCHGQPWSYSESTAKFVTEAHQDLRAFIPVLAKTKSGYVVSPNWRNRYLHKVRIEYSKVAATDISWVAANLPNTDMAVVVDEDSVLIRPSIRSPYFNHAGWPKVSFPLGDFNPEFLEQVFGKRQ